ncbi:MAG TPA: hypothetical protein VJT11_04635 [Nitrospiraceae bacterium]|nr:hypothetical protein [Nitrospiraceae bacterium]
MIHVLLLVFVVGLFTILTATIWMIIRHSFDDDQYSGDVRQSGGYLSDPGGKGEPRELASPHLKIPA